MIIIFYTWNLKKLNTKNINKLIDTENQQGRFGRMCEKYKRGKKYKLPVITIVMGM